MTDQLMDKALQSSGCPFHHLAKNTVAPNGMPISQQARDFDPFEPEYMQDPAAFLARFREEEPIFYSPELGYWVVTRYSDVKEVFRNSAVFSPANALEKITPFSEQANAVLKKHNYGMARTLVNEDEPAHMERRRALMHSFAPEELAKHEPMVRRLAKEYVDRFIDKGQADLVNEMLWEIPLTVALHFLGVPEEDMNTLRKYSIAHTVNTWGKPTEAEQVHVADAVGNFWNYAGQVLEKMREDPSGNGWMEYAIRRQKELPDVITDSYLHSMMMAGIVAAHETTAHATANAIRLLLENRKEWERICADPSLIPLTVEECLRHSGSIVAWRRVAMADTEVGGVFIPKGSKLLISNASANHDIRHFEDPHALDIFRDNVSDHLSFGYGTHQCMGMNLARMEMCIFLEELSSRLPHMRLKADQSFDYLPNTSFRGPEHLWVEWDVSQNPSDSHRLPLPIKIGAPSKQQLYRNVVVSQVQPLADDILGLTLKLADGGEFPRWTPGAHIDLIFADYSRKYSLCGDPENRTELHVAILKEEAGRGGSLYLHQHLKPGSALRIKGPKNSFPLLSKAQKYILIAGGIGITPILSMADHLKAQGVPYELHYAGRSEAAMAFLPRVRAEHDQSLRLWVKDQGQRLSLAEVVQQLGENEHIYVCGPERMIHELEDLCETALDNVLYFEHFSSNAQQLDTSQNQPFEVHLTNSKLQLQVLPEQTLLEVLLEAGVEVDYDCEEGLCGNCEVVVVEGEVEHRDSVLTRNEKASGKSMMACCSRAKHQQIKIAL